MNNIRYYIQLTDNFEYNCKLLERFLDFGKRQGYNAKPSWFRSWTIQKLVHYDMEYVKNNPNSEYRIYYFDYLTDRSFGLNGWELDIYKHICFSKNLQLVKWEDTSISEISIF